ncbi:catechol 2,3-dioxygenase-like lactoylglutathione lyase family enzyme [Naumannella cuiyingiana]|uniref:Catechol 2,3-dioxygenase-like lactoylglutathione lyase family enzyme n=1 Tax=Naumannella cuiyingiana TaxID=1347891 RepID=A0A7Z0D721_9ACTN|nr:VOC family protein [Naumannella cuiyingiana]NYI70033.1 catechol 2,3-dioxygenase-like lactoylglutathione lyase family enzyme [Naumannella cuiyingiana]
MAIIDSPGFADVHIIVSDMERAKDFYDKLFGWPEVAAKPIRYDAKIGSEVAATYDRGTVYRTPQGTLLSLHPTGIGAFDPAITGLDHVTFGVGSKADLDRATKALDEAGISYTGPIEATEVGLALLAVHDPDGLPINLTAPLT